jgi:hypothetical protein
MKHLITVLALCAAFTTSAFANSHKEAPMMKAGASCDAQATEKKLAGAAKNSFVKKCEKDTAGPAAAACETQAKEKKLAGAAKNSFVKKCVADAPKA